MENIRLTQNEENYLSRLFNLLENTHNSQNTELINSSREELNLMSENNDLSFIRLMIKGLSIITIKDKEITLEEHKSLLIFLKVFLI